MSLVNDSSEAREAGIDLADVAPDADLGLLAQTVPLGAPIRQQVRRESEKFDVGDEGRLSRSARWTLQVLRRAYVVVACELGPISAAPHVSQIQRVCRARTFEGAPWHRAARPRGVGWDPMRACRRPQRAPGSSRVDGGTTCSVRPCAGARAAVARGTTSAESTWPLGLLRDGFHFRAAHHARRRRYVT